MSIKFTMDDVNELSEALEASINNVKIRDIANKCLKAIASKFITLKEFEQVFIIVKHVVEHNNIEDEIENILRKAAKHDNI